jgi:hypothetical protein
MALIVAVTGAWLWVRDRGLETPLEQPVHPPPLARGPAMEKPRPSKPAAPGLAEVNRRAAEISMRSRQADQAAAAVIAGQTAAAETDGAIQWNHHELLVSRDRQDVVIEGVIRSTGSSSSGKSLYLHFGEKPEKNDARIAIPKNGAPADLMEDALLPLIGTKVRVRGTVSLQKGFGLECPHIHIKDRASITELD